MPVGLEIFKMPKIKKFLKLYYIEKQKKVCFKTTAYP